MYMSAVNILVEIDDAYEWNRSMKACRELEQMFGLKQIADKRRELLEPYLKKADYTRGDVKQQVSIRRHRLSSHHSHSRR